MCPNGDAATAIDCRWVRWDYADVAELAAAARAFDAVEGEDRGSVAIVLMVSSAIHAAFARHRSASEQGHASSARL